MDECQVLASRRVSVIPDSVRALFNKGTELRALDRKPELYDTLCIGSPVWVGSCPPAINSLLDNLPDLSGKKVFLFFTCSKFVGRARKQVETKLLQKGARAVLFLSLRIPGGVDSNARVQIREWVHDMGPGDCR